MGRLLGTTTQYSFLPGITYTNSYGYDAASNRRSFTVPDGSTNTYAYATLGRLTTLTDSGAGQFTMGYDAVGSTKRARPWKACMPALAKRCSRLLGTVSVKVRLKRMSSAHSIRASSAWTPRPFIRLTQSMASAAPTSTFFGSHPRSAQVPPKGLESIIATSQPAERHLEATVVAAEPVPITMRSNFFLTSRSFSQN